MSRILFGVHQQGQTLAEYCDTRVAEMKQEVRLWPKDKMRGTDDQEVVDYLIDKYQASCPVLRRDDAHSIDPVDVQLDARSPIPGIEFGQRGVRRTAMGTRRTFVIPYDGDPELFFRRPNPLTSGSLPTVDIQPGQVRIHWDQPDNIALNVVEMNTFVEQQLTSLQFYLDQVAGTNGN